MKKYCWIAIACLVLLMSGCGAHKHSFTEASCISPSVCTSCGQEAAPALGHTTTVGICSRCGECQNEPLLGLINTDFSSIMGTGADLISCISEIPSQDSKDQFEAFKKADDYTAGMKKLLLEIVDSCSPEEELEYMVFQTKLILNTCPPRIVGSDSVSLANQSLLYQLFLHQISSSFSYISVEMDRLSGNRVDGNNVVFFEEVPEMPTPDSIMFDVSYDSKRVDSGITQYMYLLGKDEDAANMIYNNYLSAIKTSGTLEISIGDTYSMVTKNGAMVSAMMAGNDDLKGYFLMVSFQG